MALIPLKYTYVINSIAGSVRRTKPSVVTAKYSTSQVPESGVAIDVDGLCFSYSNGRQILRDARLKVEEGTFHMLLGANGCGKSTLLKCLAGLATPSSGHIHMYNESVGYVFQNPDNQVVLPSVYSDVALGLGKYTSLDPKDVDLIVKHSLERVGILEYAERQTSSLSGGQKQRVAIAGALAENPNILLLDELTTFLDGKDQMNVVKSVRDIVHASDLTSREKRVTAVWVTHRMEEIDYADLVSFMDKGQILWTVVPEEAKKRMKRLGARM